MKVCLVYAYGNRWKDKRERDLVLVWTRGINRNFFRMLDKHRDELGLWENVDAKELESCYNRGGLSDVNTRMDLGSIDLLDANEWDP